MRARRKAGGVSVRAVSGTYVVSLGMNATKQAAKGLLGFAIHRTDHTENEAYWLSGFKTFKEKVPHPVPGELYSLIESPVQSFLWADYTAKTEHDYTYTIVPLYGKPRNLIQKGPVRVRIKTESVDDGKHAVYFNRGVAGSQAFVRKFGSNLPGEIGDPAYKWLSRGLLEGLLGFIKQAKGKKYGLYASVYEFNYGPVLTAFKEASKRGAEVRIVYDARKANPRDDNEAAIRANGLTQVTIPRKKGKSYISHNKFIVLTHNGKPIQVWTGSTNITRGGIFGHANVGHIVRDEKVATEFMAYWQQLATDPTPKDLRTWVNEYCKTRCPDDLKLKKGTATIFSPRRDPDEDTLNWYAGLMDNAERMVGLTAAFGVNPLLATVLAKDKDYLRYLMLERKGSNYEVFSRDRDVRIAVGSHFTRSYEERWTKEVLTGFNVHVRYIHTKIMMIDALDTKPTVVTGSANFSRNSVINNDENMLAISGDRRVADIYLGEFMRLFNHLYFRYVANNLRQAEGSKQHERGFLRSDDSWTKKYYEKDSIKAKQRELFA